LSPSAASRQADGDDAGLRAWPAGYTPTDCRKRDRARRQPGRERRGLRQSRQGIFAEGDAASPAACRRRTASRKYRRIRTFQAGEFSQRVDAPIAQFCSLGPESRTARAVSRS
jgi:hypothetical protein